MITIIVTVLVLVYKSFCNTVCIYGHANKASCCCCIALRTIKLLQLRSLLLNSELQIFHLYFLLVVCGFLRKMKTMTNTVSAAHKSIKEPGGTVVVIAPISTVYTFTVHIFLMPMESTGGHLEASTIL